MGTLDNIIGQLNGMKQAAIDGQIFTYIFRIFVSNFATHNTSAFQGNPLVTPGLNNFRFRCEDDAHFRINNITLSAYGPVSYNPLVAPDAASQLYLPDQNGATIFPLPGLLQPKPSAASIITAVNAGNDELTLTTGFNPKVGHPIMFGKTGAAVLPAGLSDNVLYFIKTVVGDVITVYLPETPGTAVNITSAGSGVFSALLMATVTTANSGGKHLFTSTSGQLYAKGQPINFFAYGVAALPTNIVQGQTYYVVPVSNNTYSIAYSPSDAIAGVLVVFAVGASGTMYAQTGGAKAERGLAIAISDLSKDARILTSDGEFKAFIPVENLFAPAYGTYNPGPLKTLEGYVLPKRHELLVEFKNRDTAGFKTTDPSASVALRPDWGHMVTMAFTGEKFYD